MVPRRLFTCSPNEADWGRDGGCTWPGDGATEARLRLLHGGGNTYMTSGTTAVRGGIPQKVNKEKKIS